MSYETYNSTSYDSGSGMSRGFIILLVVGLVCVVGVVAAVALIGNTARQTADFVAPVVIEVDGNTVEWTEFPNPINWGEVTAGNTYMRNFTVRNISNITLTVTLLTDEPPNTSQQWLSFTGQDLNNTAIPANRNATGRLALTVGVVPVYDVYEWTLQINTGNATGLPGQPTPAPTQPPTGAERTATLRATAGTNFIIVSLIDHDATVTVYPSQMPYSFKFVEGETIKFQCVPVDGYKFSQWTVNNIDNYLPNPYSAKFNSNFSIEAKVVPD